MLHPTVKSRLIFVRRLFLHTLIKFFLKILGTLLATGIDDVTIPLRDHLCLAGHSTVQRTQRPHSDLLRCQRPTEGRLNEAEAEDKRKSLNKTRQEERGHTEERDWEGIVSLRVGFSAKETCQKRA